MNLEVYLFQIWFSLFNSNINVQASFLLDRPRRDGKTGKGKNQGRGKEKNMMVEYIPLLQNEEEDEEEEELEKEEESIIL